MSQAPGNPNNFRWSTRVRWLAGSTATVYARNNAFQIEQQASFKEADPHPSAVEYLLGAVGGDIIAGFAGQAARAGVVLDALEVSVSGQLNNPLIYLGVIGETGHAGFETIDGKIYVSADTDEATLQQIWQTVQIRSPLLNTLRRCVTLNFELKITL